MVTALLDTDLLNEVLKQKNGNVVRNAVAYLNHHAYFAISAITRYEVLRGLREKNATMQLGRFQEFCDHSIVIPISDDILNHAAELWVDGRRRGLAPKDADLIIAATALTSGRVLVTGNLKDFAWINQLSINNWREF